MGSTRRIVDATSSDVESAPGSPPPPPRIGATATIPTTQRFTGNGENPDSDETEDEADGEEDVEEATEADYEHPRMTRREREAFARKDQYMQLRYESDLEKKQVIGHLRVLTPNGRPSSQQDRYEVTTGLNVVGFSEDSDICINVPGVSGTHAFIDVSEDAVEHFVEDLNSTNGTAFGEHKYRLCPFRLYQIVHNQIISFAMVKCRYEMIKAQKAGELYDVVPAASDADDVPLAAKAEDVRVELEAGDVSIAVKPEDVPLAPNAGDDDDILTASNPDDAPVSAGVNEVPVAPIGPATLASEAPRRNPMQLFISEPNETPQRSTAHVTSSGSRHSGTPSVQASAPGSAAQATQVMSLTVPHTQPIGMEIAETFEIPFNVADLDNDEDDKDGNRDLPGGQGGETSAGNEAGDYTDSEQLDASPQLLLEATDPTNADDSGDETEIEDDAAPSIPNISLRSVRSPEEAKNGFAERNNVTFAETTQGDGHADKDATNMVAKSMVAEEDDNRKRLFDADDSIVEASPVKKPRLETIAGIRTPAAAKSIKPSQLDVVPMEIDHVDPIQTAVPVPLPPSLQPTDTEDLSVVPVSKYPVRRRRNRIADEEDTESERVASTKSLPAAAEVKPQSLPMDSQAGLFEERNSIAPVVGLNAISSASEKQSAAEEKVKVSSSRSSRAESTKDKPGAFGDDQGTTDMEIDSKADLPEPIPEPKKRPASAVRRGKKNVDPVPSTSPSVIVTEGIVPETVSQVAETKAPRRGKRLKIETPPEPVEGRAETVPPKNGSSMDVEATAAVVPPKVPEKVTMRGKKAKTVTPAASISEESTQVLPSMTPSTAVEATSDDVPEVTSSVTQKATKRGKKAKTETPPVSMEVESTQFPPSNDPLTNPEMKGPTFVQEEEAVPKPKGRGKVAKPKAKPTKTEAKASDVETGSVVEEPTPASTRKGSRSRKGVEPSQSQSVPPPSAEIISPTMTPEETGASAKSSGKGSSQRDVSSQVIVQGEKTTDGFKIMFTGFTDHSPMDKIVTSLGGESVSDWHKCTHLVTDRIRRTMKFLCALSAGKIIVNVKWLDDSKKAGKFVDEKKYLLKDPKTEKQYGFTLAKSCKRAQDHTQPPIFAGLTFYATSSVMPRPEELKDILEAAGAKWSKSPPPKTPVDDFVVIGHQADAKELASLIDAGWIVHSNEFVLTGLLRMEVDYQSHILELEDKSTSKKTSSTPGRATPAARKKRK